MIGLGILALGLPVYCLWKPRRRRPRSDSALLRVHGVGQDPLRRPLQPRLERGRGVPARGAGRPDRGPRDLRRRARYGYAPLQERLARKAGVDPDRVVHATGTSMANLLVLAAAAEPGDEVLIEEPTYSLLVDAARWLRLDVRRFPRRAEDGFRLDPREVERALTPRTRLVVLTNLHNPSSAFVPPEDLRAVGDAARSVGARVLVDEVYLEALAVRGRPSGSAAHLGPEFVVTSSLTKAYGLSGLRCGWAVADPDLARRMWRLNDLFGVIPAHPAERLSVVALDHLDRVAERARRILETNTDGVNAFLAARPDLACARSTAA